MRDFKIRKNTTDRSSASAEKYLQEVGRIDLIESDEEVRLAKRIKKGDSAALNRLIEANLRFVISVSKQYQNQGLPLSDLISEGNIGLIKAARRFDETRGFKFISYAVWWIRQSIIKALTEKARIVRLPSNKINTIKKVDNAYSEMEQQLGRAPTVDEIADSTGISSENIRYSMSNSGRHVSMDAPLREGEGNTSNRYTMIEDTESNQPEKEMMNESLRSEIESSLGKLKMREAEVIRLYYGLTGKAPVTLAEIGLQFDLTRERVRQIKEKGIRKLRDTPKGRMLRLHIG